MHEFLMALIAAASFIVIFPFFVMMVVGLVWISAVLLLTVGFTVVSLPWYLIRRYHRRRSAK